MGVKKYYATKDTTITNAFKSDLTTRGSGSNMGQSDILEVFSIYGQTYFSSSASSQTLTSELSRVLIEFPVSGSALGQIKGDRTAGVIPASGSMHFYLRMYNAKHGQTLPDNITFNIQAVSSSWDEGRGLDMEEYKDKDTVNWMARTSSVDGVAIWNQPGGDYRTGSYIAGTTLPAYTKALTNGYDDLEVEVTSMVEEWIAGSAAAFRQNYGFGVYLVPGQEAYYSSSVSPLADTNGVPHNLAGPQESYYTKKFFGRGSEFFFKRPVLEARWDSAKKDDRGNFYFSSSLAPADDNLNSLYMYNFVRGQLQDIGGDDSALPVLKIYGGTATAPNTTQLTLKHSSTDDDITSVAATRIEKGIYSASFAISSSVDTTYLWDVWEVSSTQVHTGTVITPLDYGSSDYNPYAKCVSKITNLKPEYNTKETARFRLFVRDKDWSPTIYTKAYSTVQNKIVENAYYKIFRVYDKLDVVNYGTASTTQHTRLSHDVSGNYFDLDMSMLEEDYMYGIKFLYRINDVYQEQPETFRFRVIEEV
tara:strand:+ start:2693 stop:4291 length:1599 start_codon:yes stop_codon:yes gene_type:complete